VLDTVVPAHDGDVWTDFGLFLKYALRGERSRMVSLLRPRFGATAARHPQYSCFVATFHAMTGDADLAVDWLENAVDRGFINYPYLTDCDPFLARLHGNARFEKLMVRVKREWGAFEA
jgi:non-specific serine/threonine protein kinase